MKKTGFIAVGIVLVVAAVVVFMLIRDSKPSAIAIQNGSLVISGSFGTTVKISDISNLQLTKTSPEISKKTNGSGVGSTYKGEFQLKDGKNARLYIDASKSPFIVFNQGSTVYYINLETSEQTENLYQQLKEELKK